MKLRDEYDGAVCVVTGATSGNGEALAHHLHRLGADVHGIGRNREKLEALCRRRIRAYRADLSDPEDIAFLLSHLPGHIDFVFHMAGNSMTGHHPDQVRRLRESDFIGPTRLLDGLVRRMSSGTVAVNTSASAAMRDVPRLLTYQTVKREMVEWWATSRDFYFESHGVNLMLISMGLISTPIRLQGSRGRSEWLVKKLPVPGPRWWTRRILRDAALKRPVSYPGLGAKLGKLDLQGQYKINRLVDKASAVSADLWLRLVEGVR